MSARRQRQADAEQRRKELVEQLERNRDRAKKACDQVREFGEACREILGETNGGILVPEELVPALEEMQREQVTYGPIYQIAQEHETLEECCKARGIELTGEASAEATEILNEAAEDEMVEKIVDEIVEECERAELLDQVPGSSEVLKDVPWSELNEAIPEVPPNTDPATDSLLAAERQENLSDEQRPDAEVSGDADKATPSGDGWE